MKCYNVRHHSVIDIVTFFVCMYVISRLRLIMKSFDVSNFLKKKERESKKKMTKNKYTHVYWWGLKIKQLWSTQVFSYDKEKTIHLYECRNRKMNDKQIVIE